MTPRKTIIIRCEASRYQDHDDCLAAAVADAIMHRPELEGWDLSPRWEDDDTRDVILLDVPVED